jgi:adenylate kinase
MNIVLLGGPGSGKGTQAEYLEAELGLTHIATGDIFRENLNKKTPLGLVAQEYMNQGSLVPDDIVIDMMRDRLQRPDIGTGILFDGFPRTVAQAEALNTMLHDLGRHLDGVLYLEVPDDEIVNRLTGRRICRECQAPFHVQFKPFQTCPENRCQGEYLYQRDDDQPDTIRARLATFHNQTAPLVQYYTQANQLRTVPGTGSPAQVKGAVLEAARAFQTF